MPWLQLRIDSQRQDTDAIENALFQVGAVSVTLEDNADQPILEPALGETPLWQETRVTGLFDAAVDTAAILAELSSKPFALTHARWEQLEDKDWEREWMKHYHPILCGNNLWICPSWQTPPDPDAVNVLLDPGLAFGTGTHPTTFMCMRWLSQQAGKPYFADCNLLDYGCGSGILGIAARLLGASHVTAVDIDPQALQATQDNVIRNGLSPDAHHTCLPNHCPTLEADCVIANILAGPLVELAPILSQATRSGGSLCLSGILKSQANSVIQVYASQFEFDEIESLDDWVCLTAVKK